MEERIRASVTKDSVFIGYIAVSMVVEPDEGQFEAYCPDLDVSSFGESRQEATQNLEEALRVHIDSLIAHNELFDELERRKIRIYPAMPETMDLRATVHPGGCVSPFMTSVPAPTLAFA